MISKTIKLNEANYKWLVIRAGKLQQELGKTISFDETMTIIKEENEQALTALKEEMSSWNLAGYKDSIEFSRKHHI